MRNLRNTLRICGWCLAFVVAEIGLYLSYRHHDARFHWILHFFVGGSAALLVMSVVAWRQGKAVSFPLVWLLVGHVFAMLPDFLFLLFGIIHDRWMDVFLWHIGAHFIPGRNLTWYLIFLAALAVYLSILARVGGEERIAV